MKQLVGDIKRENAMLKRKLESQDMTIQRLHMRVAELEEDNKRMRMDYHKIQKLANPPDLNLNICNKLIESVIEVDARTLNALHRNGCELVGDIIKKNPSELFNIRGIGEKSFYLLLMELKRLNLKLNGSSLSRDIPSTRIYEEVFYDKKEGENNVRY